MDEEKQIDGILKIMCKFKKPPYTESHCETCVFNDTCYYRYIAKEIYNDGYRKNNKGE